MSVGRPLPRGAVVAIACLAFAAWLGAVLAAADVPYLSGRVVDHAEILRPQTRAALAASLKVHEERTTNQVVVLTIPTLAGESIEDYAVRVFAAWQLGQRGRDNGVLVVVAPSERRMRIEVGYGLEGTLTDVQAARIIRDRMTPRFKANDFDGGVTAGVEAIVAVLEGGAGAAAPDAAPGGHAVDGLAAFEQDLPPWPLRILLGAFIFGVIGLFTFLGIVMPGVGWFLYVFLIPFWAMFPIIVVGVKGALVCLALYLVGFPIAKLLLRSSPRYQQAAAELRRKGTTTFGGVVITSGGHGSGGSSSGGFSGGGGSSGGGGASGSW